HDCAIARDGSHQCRSQRRHRDGQRPRRRNDACRRITPRRHHRAGGAKEGSVPDEQTLSLAPGQKMSIRAKLPLEKTPLYERWWFWTMLGGVVASIAVTSYIVLRPEPEQPPCDGGLLGW